VWPRLQQYSEPGGTCTVIDLPLLADFRLLRKATFDRILPVATVSYVPVSTGCGRQKPADSVEKVGSLELPGS
jgi:hypothetical protein